MGYHVSILRTSASRVDPIGRDAFIRAFCEEEAFRDSASSDDEFVFVLPDGSTARLRFLDGEAWTANPDEAMIELMLRIADRLGARVRGDELETYRSPSETYCHPDDRRAQDAATKECDAIVRRTRRKNLLVNGAIFAVFVVIGVIARSCSH